MLAGVAASLCVCALAAGATDRQARADRRAQGKLDEANRREGAALLSLADAAMAGRLAVEIARDARDPDGGDMAIRSVAACASKRMLA